MRSFENDINSSMEIQQFKFYDIKFKMECSKFYKVYNILYNVVLVEFALTI